MDATAHRCAEGEFNLGPPLKGGGFVTDDGAEIDAWRLGKGWCFRFVGAGNRITVIKLRDNAAKTLLGIFMAEYGTPLHDLPRPTPKKENDK